MKKNEVGFAHVALVAIIVIVFITGVGIYVFKSDNSKNINREATETESNLVSPLPEDLLTVNKIKELATVEAPNIELTSVELENEDGVYVYKVKLANGTTLYFNAQTGEKVTHDDEEDEPEDGTIPTGFEAAISFDKAREIALTQKPNGVIRKIELEVEEGKVVYSVRFTDDARIDIDATSGAIVRSRPAKTEDEADTSNSGSGSNTSGSTNDDSDDDDTSNGGSGSSNSGSGSDGDDN